MKLYVCWGTFPTPRPGGHPCANAYHALKDAGYEPELVKSYGFAPLPAALPERAVLAFGTERYGLSRELMARADAAVSIPMAPGVSSLNLATSVAAVLFAWRLSPRVAPQAA